MDYYTLDEALEYIEAVNEGVNKDILSQDMKIRKEYRSNVSDAKKFIKDKEYKKAKESIGKARGALDDYIKFLDDSKEDDTKGSKIISGILGTLVMISDCTVPLAITAAGAIGVSITENKLKQIEAKSKEIHITEVKKFGVDELVDMIERTKKRYEERQKERNKVGNFGIGAALIAIAGSIVTIVVAILTTIKNIKEIQRQQEEAKKDGKEFDNNILRIKCREQVKKLQDNLKKLEDQIGKAE